MGLRMKVGVAEDEGGCGLSHNVVLVWVPIARLCFSIKATKAKFQF